MQGDNQQKNVYKSVLLVGLGVFFLVPSIVCGEVNGRFVLQQTHSEIVLDVTNPPPQSIIIEQRVRGIVAETIPKAQKIQKDSVTWLIRDPRPGSLHLATQFKNPVGETSATIKYKDRGSGQFVQRVITP